MLLGRDTEVAQVQSYIEGESDRPLVMVGFPGSGKSSMAAYMVKKCLQNSKYKVRFLVNYSKTIRGGKYLFNPIALRTAKTL